MTDAGYRDYSESPGPQEDLPEVDTDAAYEGASARGIQAELQKEVTDGMLPVEDIAGEADAEPAAGDENEVLKNQEETFDEVFARREAVAHRMGVLKESIEAKLPDHAEVMHQAIGQAFTQSGRDMDNPDEKVEAIAEAVSDIVGPEKFAEIEAEVREIFPAIDAHAVLKGRTQELADQEVEKLRQELAETVDWDLIVRLEAAGRGNQLPEGFDELLAIAGDMKGVDDQKILLLSTARNWKAFIEANEVLQKPEGYTPEEMPEEYAERLEGDNLAAAMTQWCTDNLEACQTYLNSRREAGMECIVRATEDLQERLAPCLHLLKLDGKSDEGHTTPPLLPRKLLLR